MFTGIIEAIGEVRSTNTVGGNLDLWIEAAMTPELRVDQSLAHNGVCLTVVEVKGGAYRVTAVKETLERSTLGSLVAGDRVNLERCLRVGDRLDGHMVQGHVDTVVECRMVKEEGGSWRFTFALPEKKHLIVPKGSICLNGVSLTVAALLDDTFDVAIIPYTYDHTTFRSMRPGAPVNVEFDILGKYVERMIGSGGFVST